MLPLPSHFFFFLLPLLLLAEDLFCGELGQVRCRAKSMMGGSLFAIVSHSLLTVSFNGVVSLQSSDHCRDTLAYFFFFSLLFRSLLRFKKFTGYP